MRRKLIVFSILILNLLSPSVINAHPGRTAADGCHYCRTNCDSWGVAWNERHCHNGGTIQGVQEQPIYTAPTNTPISLPTWTPVPTNTPSPTNTPIPTLTDTPTPSPIKKLTITSKKKVSPVNKSNKNKIPKKKTFWQWLFNR